MTVAAPRLAVAPAERR